VVDLPGIYSMRPYTQEEIVSRNFICNEKPDGIINIVDATNIERNLYLTLQLMELQVPMVLALNMMDEVRANGGTIDVEKMSEALGIPVVPISAAKGEGVSELVETGRGDRPGKGRPKVTDFCAPAPRSTAASTPSVHLIEDHADRLGVPPRFCATKLIEGDEAIGKAELELDQNERELLEHCVVEMETETGLDRNAALADMRYTFIEKVVAASVVKCHESREHRRHEDRPGAHRQIHGHTRVSRRHVPGVLAHLQRHRLGLSDWLSLGIDWLTALVDAGLTAYGINPVVHSLIIDGVFAGVGSVLSFLPIIVVLFFFLSILEDTGYMARVAFVMDKLLRKIGLSGRSFVPMLIGFGCSVPAIMATRTVSSDRDRKMTILLTPYMSCSAKIPIYAVFTAAFFPKDGALVMIASISRRHRAGVLVALLLKSTAFRGSPCPSSWSCRTTAALRQSVGCCCGKRPGTFCSGPSPSSSSPRIVIWFLQTFDTRLNVVGRQRGQPAGGHRPLDRARYSRRWASPTGAWPRRWSPASPPRRPW
jgi:ferrous iron transport protein B